MAQLSNSATAHTQGGLPTLPVDVAPTSVFLALFFVSAVTHATLLRRNLTRGRLFPFLGLGMVFSIIRCATMSLRLGWTFHLENRSLAIAAAIFVAAGIIILFVVNLFLAQRIFRAAHPNLGWTLPARLFFRFWIVLIPPMLIMLITVFTQSYYTTNPHILKIDRGIKYFGMSYLLCLAFLPIPMVLLALFLPKKQPRDNFGTGKWSTKIFLVLTTSTLLSLSQGFKAAMAFMPEARAASDPWWTEQWTFYFFDFTLEFIVLYLNIVFRFDKRFYIPKGCHNPGDYTGRLAWDLDRQRKVVNAKLRKGDEEEYLEVQNEKEKFRPLSKGSSKVLESEGWALTVLASSLPTSFDTDTREVTAH